MQGGDANVTRQHVERAVPARCIVLAKAQRFWPLPLVRGYGHVVRFACCSMASVCSCFNRSVCSSELCLEEQAMRFTQRTMARKTARHNMQVSTLQTRQPPPPGASLQRSCRPALECDGYILQSSGGGSCRCGRLDHGSQLQACKSSLLGVQGRQPPTARTPSSHRFCKKWSSSMQRSVKREWLANPETKDPAW